MDRAFAFHAARLKRARAARAATCCAIPDSDASWKKYRLSDEKTFESLFFADKASVLESLDTFEKRRAVKCGFAQLACCSGPAGRARRR